MRDWAAASGVCLEDVARSLAPRNVSPPRHLSHGLKFHQHKSMPLRFHYGVFWGHGLNVDSMRSQLHPSSEPFHSQAPSFGGWTQCRPQRMLGNRQAGDKDLDPQLCWRQQPPEFPRDPASEGPTCPSANCGWCVLG